MSKQPSVKCLLDDALCLDVQSGNDDPILQRIADCIRRLHRPVEGCFRDHGRATTMIALTVVAKLAADSGDSAEIAEAFREHADLPDIQEGAGFLINRA